MSSFCLLPLLNAGVTAQGGGGVSGKGEDQMGWTLPMQYETFLSQKYNYKNCCLCGDFCAPVESPPLTLDQSLP